MFATWGLCFGIGCATVAELLFFVLEFIATMFQKEHKRLKIVAGEDEADENLMDAFLSDLF